jgi:putative transposase
MKEHNLLVKPNLRLMAKRDNQFNSSKPKASHPYEYWDTDMMKVMIRSFGWLYLVIVLDWYTKNIVGYSLLSHSKTGDWLNALYSACNNQLPDGVLSKQDNLYLISNNGSLAISKEIHESMLCIRD